MAVGDPRDHGSEPHLAGHAGQVAQGRPALKHIALWGAHPAYLKEVVHNPEAGEAHRVRGAGDLGQAHGTAGRFLKLLDASSANNGSRNVAMLHLYFQAVEAALQGQPLMVLDPKATGRKHLMLTQPGSGNLPLLAQPLGPGDDEEQIVSPPSTRDNRPRDPR